MDLTRWSRAEAVSEANELPLSSRIAKGLFGIAEVPTDVEQLEVYVQSFEQIVAIDQILDLPKPEIEVDQLALRRARLLRDVAVHSFGAPDLNKVEIALDNLMAENLVSFSIEAETKDKDAINKAVSMLNAISGGSLKELLGHLSKLSTLKQSGAQLNEPTAILPHISIESLAEFAETFLDHTADDSLGED